MHLLTKLLNTRTVRLGAAVAFLVFFYTISLFFSQSANAATSYSYASNGSKIAVNYNGTNYTLTKAPLPQGGKDDYRGVIKIAWTGGNQCNLGVQVLVSSGASSGTVASPAFLNGIPGAGSPGSSTTPSCPRDFAQSRTEFNQGISISGSANDDSGPPPSAETDGQKQAVVTAYSPTKTPPSASVSMTRTGQAGSQTKTLSWNGSVASVRWSSIAAGSQLRFCITPANVFGTQSCKTATKKRGTPLLVDFGSFENSYNEDGKKVIVTVNFKVAAAPRPTTYGPIPLTIYTADGESKGTASTNSNTYGDEDNNGPTPAQNGTLEGRFDGINPGRYKVCITGNDDICSPLFVKETNLSARTTINVSEEDSKNLITEDENSTSCAVEGVGWIICPIINFLAGISDGAFGAISSFLTVNTSLYSGTDSNSGTYAAWSAFRNIANVAFVILFIFIIYSQLTGMGVSNYGIKKTLPRLIVAAVLVNLSFFVCQLAVDITQIIGGSINGFLQNIRVSGSTATLSTWSELMSNVLAGTLLVGGAAIGAAILALSISIPLLLAFLLAVVMTVIILVGREAAIVILIILSPLAFVAYLLPNTEKWFKRWYQMFGTLLMVYPIIALLYGGGALASKIISNAASTSDGGINSFALGLTAIAVSAIPLIMTPTILKNAMNGAGGMGKWLSGKASKANSRIMPKAQEGYKNSAWGRGRAAKKQARQNFKDRRFAGKVVKGGATGKIAAIAAGGIGKTASQKYAQQSLERSAIAVNDKARGEDINTAASLMMERHDNPSTQIKDISTELESAFANKDAIKARAAQSLLLGMGGKGLDALESTHRTLLATPEARNSDVGKSLRNALNSAGLKGKNNALATAAYADKSIDQITSDAGTFNLSSNELGNQRLGLLQRAVAAKPGIITQEQAKNVLSSPEVTKDMDIEKKALFEDIRDGKLPYSPSSATGALKAAKTAQGSAPTTAATTAAPSSPAPQPPPAGQQTNVWPGPPMTPQAPAAPQANNPVLTIPHTPTPPANPASAAKPPTDSAGRQTPPTAASPDDYHDGMSR